jgi:hypothetical protein
MFLENDVQVQLNGLRLVYDRAMVQRLLAYFLGAVARSVGGLNESEEDETAKPREKTDWSRNHVEVEVGVVWWLGFEMARLLRACVQINDPEIILPPVDVRGVGAQVWKLHMPRVYPISPHPPFSLSLAHIWSIADRAGHRTTWRAASGTSGRPA